MIQSTELSFLGHRAKESREWIRVGNRREAPSPSVTNNTVVKRCHHSYSSIWNLNCKVSRHQCLSCQIVRKWGRRRDNQWIVCWIAPTGATDPASAGGGEAKWYSQLLPSNIYSKFLTSASMLPGGDSLLSGMI